MDAFRCGRGRVLLAAIAAWLPARRAAAVDPADVLRTS
jgi:ABC-type lipoprotein release transport system permease subunit